MELNRDNARRVLNFLHALRDDSKKKMFDVHSEMTSYENNHIDSTYHVHLKEYRTLIRESTFYASTASASRQLFLLIREYFGLPKEVDKEINEVPDSVKGSASKLARWTNGED